MQEIVEWWFDWPFTYWFLSAIALSFLLGLIPGFFIVPMRSAPMLVFIGLIISFLLFPIFRYAIVTVVLFFLSFTLQGLGAGALIRSAVARRAERRTQP